jgi:hypothetical protein
MLISLTTYGQSAARNSISISAIGHMAVTLLSPAALTSQQNLAFNDIQLRSGQSTSASVDCDVTKASIRVSGNAATYSVTVSNGNMGVNQKGNNLNIGNFSAVCESEPSGSSSIYIGATMSIAKSQTLAASANHDPLTIIINYN